MRIAVRVLRIELLNMKAYETVEELISMYYPMFVLLLNVRLPYLEMFSTNHAHISLTLVLFRSLLAIPQYTRPVLIHTRLTCIVFSPI